jgi:hypothetical protein
MSLWKNCGLHFGSANFPIISTANKLNQQKQQAKTPLFTKLKHKKQPPLTHLLTAPINP